MRRWFVVNLASPRKSWATEAEDQLRAVALVEHTPASVLESRVAKLEGSYLMAAATWAVWPVDQLGTYPLLVRERCE